MTLVAFSVVIILVALGSFFLGFRFCLLHLTRKQFEEIQIAKQQKGKILI